MKNKTCGDCKWFVLNPEGSCRSTDGEENANNDCCSFFELKVITNGDKIRQMSDEELAVFLNSIDYMMREAYKDEERTLFSSAYELWLTYLKQEAKDE